MTDIPETTDASNSVADDRVDDLPEQIAVRHEKRRRLLDDGRQAYPVRVPRTDSLAAVRDRFPDLEAGSSTGGIVAVAGRVIFVRNTGKLCFARIREGAGTELQVMVSLDQVGEESLDEWKRMVDIGDVIAAEGEVISSRTGELSVMAQSWQFAAKALRPLPVAHKELGEETRVRQRYVDLIMRPEAQSVARLRPRVMASLRSTFDALDYLEVETPMLQTQHGGATARPFVTHSNAFDIDLYLRIAPELFLKRCVVGGLERVYEINRNFRNEGADRSHSPEFAMLEWYEAYADYLDMARITRELIQNAALAAHGSLAFELADGSTRDLSGEWDTRYVYPSVSEAVGEEITPRTPVQRLNELCHEAGIRPEPTWVPGKYVEELLEHHVVETLNGPTFLLDYPEDTSPLVRGHREHEGMVEKWDLYIGGYEQATGYSELVDPVVQRQRLEDQSALRTRGDTEAMSVDEDFLRALEHGMPPTGGAGMGIDRLLMSLTGLGIRETILFPLVKPQERS